ncbi:hypothetical protein A9Q99_20370 [Gammaproteobacteria bacterium 45_16_T64]|nr:hypothetical protein A9Q99_20370 [Gammaproteobacteria bacterium 45_16_T64]
MSANGSALDAVNTKIRELRRQYEMISARDRLLLNGLVMFLGVIAIIFLLIQPAYNSVARAEQELANKQELLNWMKSNEHRVKKSNTSSKAKARKPGQSLLALINQTSGRHQVALKRYEPDGSDKLRVWVENVSFNSLMRWLTGLESKYGVTVINISIDSQKEPGIINAKVVLKG